MDVPALPYINSDSDIFFDEITFIKVLPPQHVYDLSIENTHNFIANDIIAHNTGRYFQYKADFNTTDAKYTPILNNVTINFTGILTDSFGNYNFTLTAPSAVGGHVVRVNTTFETTLGAQQNATFTVIQSANIASGSLFVIINNSNNRLAVFDSAGFINIRGSLTQNAEPTADWNDFVVQNSSGGLNLVITNPEGNLLIKGSLNQNQASPLSPTLSAFIVQNSTGRVIAYVNSTGGLFLTGNLTQYASLD